MSKLRWQCTALCRPRSPAPHFYTCNKKDDRNEDKHISAPRLPAHQFTAEGDKTLLPVMRVRKQQRHCRM